MARYFYLVTSLPELQIGLPPELSLQELSFLLEANLSKSDLIQAERVKSFFDLENIRSFWSGFPLNREGNFDEVTLEEALVGRVGLPFYVYDFMDRYENKEDRLKHFSSLLTTYFREEMKRSSGFLHKLLKLERDQRLVLAALRSKKLGRDPLVEFQYEDPDDALVAQILAQKDAKVYDPPEEYQELKALYDQHQDSPLELQKALLEYRFRKIESIVGLETFTLERVLAYIYQWILAEKWVLLDRKKGQQIINTIVQGVAYE
jgi:hypothetical protein